MNNTTQLKAKLTGERILARHVMNMIPLIEKHFAAFDGQRVLIDSGACSAPFKKLTRAFLDNIDKTDNLRVIVDASGYSVWVKLDVHLPNPSGSGVTYFEQSLYIGKIDHQTFFYNFDGHDYYQTAQQVRALTVKQLMDAKKEYTALQTAMNAVSASYPFTFKKFIEG